MAAPMPRPAPVTSTIFFMSLSVDSGGRWWVRRSGDPGLLGGAQEIAAENADDIGLGIAALYQARGDLRQLFRRHDLHGAGAAIAECARPPFVGILLRRQ